MNRLASVLGIFVATLVFFAGCGRDASEREYDKAMEERERGHLVQARALLEKAIRKTSVQEKKAVACNKLGLILWDLGEIAAATDAFETAAQLTEGLSGVHLNQGVGLFHAGQLEEAKIIFNNVLGEDPGNETAQVFLGLIEMERKNWKEAAVELGRALANNPHNPVLHTAAALAELHGNQDSAGARTRLERVASVYPAYTSVLFNLGVLYEKWLNDPVSAVDRYQRYLSKAGPEAPRSNQAKAAIKRLAKNQTNLPGSLPENRSPVVAARRLVAEGSRLHAEKNYTAAIALYMQAIQADPSQKNAHYNMAVAYYAVNDFSKTLQACTDALAIDPAFADARYMLSLAYYRLGQFDDAEREANALENIDADRGDAMLRHIAAARHR